jgi:hypothetical protein
MVKGKLVEPKRMDTQLIQVVTKYNKIGRDKTEKYRWKKYQ